MLLGCALVQGPNILHWLVSSRKAWVVSPAKYMCALYFAVKEERGRHYNVALRAAIGVRG